MNEAVVLSEYGKGKNSVSHPLIETENPFLRTVKQQQLCTHFFEQDHGQIFLKCVERTM